MASMATFDSTFSRPRPIFSRMSQQAPTLARRALLMGFVFAGCANGRVPQRGVPMIVEYIRYEIPTERAEEFIAAYRDAATDLRASPHCHRYEVTRCTEAPMSFVVRIEWDSVEGHLQGFRNEPRFGAFFTKVKPFFDHIREMRHYELTDVVSS
jgi:quinol monooxygenase YgiN